MDYRRTACLAKEIGKRISRRLVSALWQNLGGITKITRRLFLVPDSDKLGRRDGISLLVVSRNEPWLDLSLRSVKDYVNEIVLVDASDGLWRSEVDGIASRFGVRLFRIGTDYKTQTREALLKSRYKWLLRWDGDFVALPKQISQLKQFTENSDPAEYYGLSLVINNLELNPFHFDPGLLRRHSEKYLFSYSPRLIRSLTPLANWWQFAMSFRGQGIVKRLPRRIGYAPAPLWFKRQKMPQPIALHLRTIKPWRRIVEKKFQPYWTLLSQKEKLKYGNDLWKFVEEHTNPVSLYKQMVKNLRSRLIKYEGVYPKLMRDYMTNVLNVEFGLSPEFLQALHEYVNRWEMEVPNCVF